MKKNAIVITVSDKGSQGLRQDASGPLLAETLQKSGWEVIWTTIVPDEPDEICRALIHSCDQLQAQLILTTGGTGFSPRDITPEATMEVVDRLTPGIAEAMRAESMRITPRGCLSRSVAGIRGRSLIINLPGSPRAALENWNAVAPAIDHGVEMLASNGSADCARTGEEKQAAPSLDLWLKEAKAGENAKSAGMYLFHNGVVRGTSRASQRENAPESAPVQGMDLSWDPEKVEAARQHALSLAGITCARVWLNRGRLQVGDDLMLVLVGGNVRSSVLPALEALVSELKEKCITEKELF